MKKNPDWSDAKKRFLRAWTLVFTLAALGVVTTAAVVGIPIGLVEVLFGVGIGAGGGLLSGVGMWELYVKPRLVENEINQAAAAERSKQEENGKQGSLFRRPGQ